MEARQTLLWLSPEPMGKQESVEAVAGASNVAVHFGGYSEAFTLLRRERGDLIGIELGHEAEPGLALVREIHERLPTVPILAASADTDFVMMRQALEAGASDFISLPLTAQELQKALIKFTHRNTPSRTTTAPVIGEVITLCGARGGLGVTTLAVNLAVRMTRLTDSKVALVDLDLQRGDVGTFLNLTPTQSLTALAGHGEIDELLFFSTLTRHPSGVFVLAAPTQLEDAELIGHEEVTAALNLMRSRFRFSFVDTARMLTPATLAALAQTDRVLLLTDLSVPGVRSARRMVDILNRLKNAAQRIDLLVMQTGSGAIALADAVRAIGIEPLFTIPRDEAAALSAVNAGAPLNGKRPSGLSAAIDELATKLAGPRAASPDAKRGGLFHRMFTKGAST